MKTKFKLIRLVFASSVGSLLWAGCAGPNMTVTQTGFDPGMVSAAPVDHINRRADTHPEWRSAIWQFGMSDLKTSRPTRVLETTVVERYDEVGADSTHLLVFNPEVINVAATPVPVGSTTVVTTGPGGTIVEAAGAARPATATGISSAQERWAGGVITTTIAPAAP